MPRALRSTHAASIRATLLGPDSLARVALLVSLGVFVFTWPALIDPNHKAIGGAGGDFASISWGLWRVAEALPGWPELQTHLLVAPQGSTLLVADPLGSLLISPVTLLVGPVAAFNALQTTHLILAAVCCWLLLRQLGLSSAGRWAGAVSFSCSPVLLSGAHNGNPDVTPLFFLPLCAWMAPRIPESWRWATGFGVVLGLSVWSNPYVAVMSGVIALALTIQSRPKHFGRLALAAGIAVGSAVVFYFVVSHSLALPDAAVAKTTTRPTTAGVAHLAGYIWPIVQQQPHPWFVHSWYLGLAGLGLAGLGLRDAPLRRVWLTTAAVGLILSLGPALAVTDSLFFAGPIGTGAKWMPGYWLRQIPGLDSLQIVYRYAALPALTVAILAGFGVDRLAAKPARWAAVAVIAIDLLWVLPGASLLKPAKVIQSDACTLLEGLETGAVINLPPSDDERWMLEQTCHGRAVAQGINRLGHREVREVLRRQPNQIIKGLSQKGFAYLLIHSEASIQEHAQLPPRPENDQMDGLIALAEARGLVAARSDDLLVVDLNP